jgi:catalase
MADSKVKKPGQYTGEGGELHQTASEPEARITTNHGMPVSDDQNSLKAGSRGPSLLEDFVLRTSITNAYRNALFTLAGRARMDILS